MVPVYATPQEVLDAFRRLTHADHLHLRQIARIAMQGSPFTSPAELVADAATTAYLAAAENGGRRWPRDVPFVAYLVMTIRGLASDARRRMLRKAQEGLEFLDAGHDSSAAQPFTPSIEQLCADTPDGQWLETVRVFFRRDPLILRILEGLSRGMSPQEIRTQEGMTETEYGSARKRLRRSLERSRQALASRKGGAS